MTINTAPELTKKACQECTPGTPPLSKERVSELQRLVPQWELQDGRLTRRLALKNFKEALEFLNRIGAIAEREGHHPDMCLFSWNKVKVELYTHSIGGLSENDFIMAAKIGELT